MSIPQTVGEVLPKHVILELESLDRVYLNVYQPKLQTPKAVFCFLREYYGAGGMALSYRTWIVSGVGGQTCDEIAQKSVRAADAQTFPIDIRPTFL